MLLTVLAFRALLDSDGARDVRYKRVLATYLG
jgi:hypothetical protein